MRIRFGFVSNSSSSSFVVAFPRKPESVEDVLGFMFKGKKEGGIDYYGDVISYRRIAERVFSDIQSSTMSGFLARVVDLLSERYHYSPNIGGGGVHWGNGFTDSNGGSWYGHRDRYFGADNGLMDEYARVVTDFELRERDLRVRLGEIEEKRFCVPEVECAYKGGINHRTKKEYSKEEIRAYNEYRRKLDAFKQSDVEFVRLSKELNGLSNEKYRVEKELRLKIARVDGNNFYFDNRGKFIFVVKYGDEDGDGALEHGGIFDSVPHIVVNQH